MVRLLDEPPGEPFTAYRTTRRLPLKGASFDRDAALRLHRLTARATDPARWPPAAGPAT